MTKIKNSKLIKARAGLIIDQPFFASILLPMVMSEDKSCPTMGTDGETMIYNPDWIETLTLAETTFVLAHETLHCVFDHMGRRGEKNHNVYNQAADYIINELLVNEKIGTMPKQGLYNPKLVKDGGGTAEGVYNILIKDEKNKSKNAGDKGGALDNVNDAGTNNGSKPTDAATLAEKSAQLKVRVIQAKNAAKMQGKLSAGLERLVDEATKPLIDWREVLRRFVSERAKSEYTFARPKRRFLGEDFYLPSLSGERMGVLTIAVDCSGSVDQDLLSMFASEVNAIREDLMPSRIEIVYFDSEVCKTEIVEPEDTLKIKAVGGGGTAFSPVFNYINKQNEEPVCVIFLTDLVCDDFGPMPDYPVLWVCLENLTDGFKNPPFGEIVEVRND